MPHPASFGELPAIQTGVPWLIALSCSFSPSLQPAFPAFFATTASADCSHALTRELSPGKVHELSARSVRLYRLRLSVTVGFRVLSHAHRPQTASLPVRVPTAAPLLRTSFVLSASRHPPCLSLRLLSLNPNNLLSFCLVHAHAGHTTAAAPGRSWEKRSTCFTQCHPDFRGSRAMSLYYPLNIGSSPLGDRALPFPCRSVLISEDQWFTSGVRLRKEGV